MRYLIPLLFAPLLWGAELKVQVSWGHGSAKAAAYYVRLQPLSQGMEVRSPEGDSLESGDEVREGAWQTTAGAGDVDGMRFSLVYPETPERRLENLQVIWRDLIAHSDPDTALRLMRDPAFRTNPRKLGVWLNPEGTRGFAVSVDQLLRERAIWVPSLDVYITAGDKPVPFDEHRRELAAWKGRRILDRLHAEPEATYAPVHGPLGRHGVAQLCSPQPARSRPHRRPHLGQRHSEVRYRPRRRRVERLRQPRPLPVLVRFRRFNPRHCGTRGKARALPTVCPSSPPLSKKTACGTRWSSSLIRSMGRRPSGAATSRWCCFRRCAHQPDLPPPALSRYSMAHGASSPGYDPGTVTAERRTAPPSMFRGIARQQVLLAVEGVEGEFQWNGTHDYQQRAEPAGRHRLPGSAGRRFARVRRQAALAGRAAGKGRDARAASTTAGACADRSASGPAMWSAARNSACRKRWSTICSAPASGTRCGCRGGTAATGSEVAIDLPYSNFAYSQTGTPWPVNQAVYVDYMLYDLRGYHGISDRRAAGAVSATTRSPTGTLTGFANWVVYTPGMLYAVAQNYLLSRDREALRTHAAPSSESARLVPEGTPAGSGANGSGARPGSAGRSTTCTGEGVWAFNQAYLYAGLERFGRALEIAGHPRASEALEAARRIRESVARDFGAAVGCSPPWSSCATTPGPRTCPARC